MNRRTLNKSAPTQSIFLLQVTFNLLQGGNSFSFLILIFSFVLTIFLLHFFVPPPCSALFALLAVEVI